MLQGKIEGELPTLEEPDFLGRASNPCFTKDLLSRAQRYGYVEVLDWDEVA